MTASNEFLVKVTTNIQKYKDQYSAIIADLLSKAQPHEALLTEFWVETADTHRGGLFSKVWGCTDGDDRQEAKLKANAQTDAWLNENLINATLENRIAFVLWADGVNQGVEYILQQLPAPVVETGEVTLRMTVDVTYTLNGESQEELIARLRDIIDTAYGNGAFTDASEAEVVNHEISIEEVKPAPAAVQFADEDFSILEAELARKDLSIYAAVVMARTELEDGDISAVLSRLRADADKLRMHSKPLYDLLMKY